MEFDLTIDALRHVNQALHNCGHNHGHVKPFVIRNPKGRHAVAVGMTHEIQVTVDGHVGYYCGGMNQSAHIIVRGNAGPGVAENMVSGSVLVEGNASQYAGASGHGGLLTIKGNTSSRCGISMKGIDIVVGGSVGHFSAFMAQSGRLVVCGDAEHDLGDSIYEAQVFVRGDVESLGSDCIEKEMRPEHVQALDRLLEQSGFEFPVTDFRRFGSARTLYNFKIDNADAIR